MFCDLDPDSLDLPGVFILADQIHQWIYDHEDKSLKAGMNYLDLSCLGSNDGWAATFDCLPYDDCEWIEHIEDYEFAAKGACPEEAIYLAAMKTIEAIEKL